jgi:hypothetical protein
MVSKDIEEYIVKIELIKYWIISFDNDKYYMPKKSDYEL